MESKGQRVSERKRTKRIERGQKSRKTGRQTGRKTARKKVG